MNQTIEKLLTADARNTREYERSEVTLRFTANTTTHLQAIDVAKHMLAGSLRNGDGAMGAAVIKVRSVRVIQTQVTIDAFTGQPIEAALDPRRI